MELPQEETEAFQPEVSAEARPLAKEGPEEMDMQGQEDNMGITESSPPPIGQGGARKGKPSQDREPSKLIVRLPERREGKVRKRTSSGSKGLIKKLGEKTRDVMRTSPLPDRT